MVLTFKVTATVLVVSGGLWEAIRPLTGFERNATDASRLAFYQRLGVIAGTIAIAVWIWA
jgi:hypothetical protein